MIPGLGGLAALAWLMVSAVTFIGAVALGSGSVWLNLAFCVLFAGVAGVLAWRARALAALCRRYPGSPEVRRLMRADGVAAAAMLVLGGLCLAGVVTRVFVEGFAVFG